MEEAEEYQTNLLVEIMNFRKNRKPRSQEKKKKKKKKLFLKTCINFWEGKEKVLDAFQSKIFSIKSKGAGILNPDHSKLKKLTY